MGDLPAGRRRVSPAASTASRRSTRSARATRSIRRAAVHDRLRRLPRRGADRRPAPRRRRAIRAPSRSPARDRGEVLVSEPYARRFGVRDRRDRHDPDAAAARAPSASPASTATTRTTAAPSCSTASSTARSSGDRPRHERRRARRAGRRRRPICAAGSSRPPRAVSRSRSRRTASCAARCSGSSTGRSPSRARSRRSRSRVAILGIANALVASAVERRRTFGLLRAVGASGAQIRRAVAPRGGPDRARRHDRGALAPAPPSRRCFSASSTRSPSAGRSSLEVPGARLASAAALVLARFDRWRGSFRAASPPRVDPAAALQEE